MEGEEVSDFRWRGARGVRKYAVERVFVATERVLVFATGEGLAFPPGQMLVRIRLGCRFVQGTEERAAREVTARPKGEIRTLLQ